MSKKKNKKAAAAGPVSQAKTICENRKARHRFEVLDSLECGLMLLGSEVKSLREGHVSLDESYGRMREDEVWLLGCDIPEFKQASIWNHEPKRPRKLLLHRRQIEKFASSAREKGLTLVPLRLYFNDRGVAKLSLGLCRGKKQHDKREALKKADMKRDMERAMRRG